MPDIIGECSAEVTYTPTATDCEGTIYGTTSDPLIYTEQGTYTINWTYTNQSGGATMMNQVVIVDDTTPPETQILDDIVGECSASVTFTPTTTDNCSDDITGTTSDPLEYAEQGTFVITWNFVDEYENSIDVEQNIIVEDITDPTISCPADQTIDLNEGEIFYTVVGTEFDPTETDDNCDVETAINDFNSTATLDGAELPIGENTITWTATDIAGNEVTCSFMVTVNEFVGISDLSEIGISIYPNPSNGIFTIETQDNYEITITDISGKVIQRKDVACNVSTAVDLTGNANGVYFIKFQNNELVKTVKIIKE